MAEIKITVMNAPVQLALTRLIEALGGSISVEVGTNVVYGAIHQFGGVAGRRAAGKFGPVRRAAGNGLLVSFAAPSDGVAADWFTDATTDSDQLQYVFIPVGITRTFVFDTKITRWDMVAVGGGSMTIYQEKTR